MAQSPAVQADQLCGNLTSMSEIAFYEAQI